MIYGDDLNQFYYWIGNFIYSFRYGSLQTLLISPWNFLGFPYLFNLQYGVLSPFSLLSLFFGAAGYINSVYLISLIICFLGSYLFINQGLELKKTPSLLGAVIFTFNGFVFPRIFAGHLNVITTYSWIPICLYSITAFAKERKSRYLLLFMIFLYMQLTSGFVNIFIISFMVYIVWFFNMLQKPKIKSLLSLITIKNVLITVVFGGVFIMITLLFSQVINESQRSMNSSFLFSSSFSLPIKNFITFISPNYFGSPVYKDTFLSANSYHGEFNYWELSAFFGVGALLLSIMGTLKNWKSALFWLLVLLFGILMSIGSNGFLFEFVFKFIPFYRFIRIPAQHLFLVILSISILSSYGLEAFEDKKSVNTIGVRLFGILVIVFSSLSMMYMFGNLVQYYASINSNTFYNDDYGDKDIAKNGKTNGNTTIDLSKLHNIQLIDEGSWKIVNSTLMPGAGGVDKMIFKLKTGFLGMVIVQIQSKNALPEHKFTIMCSSDNHKWTKCLQGPYFSKTSEDTPQNNSLHYWPMKRLYLMITNQENESSIGIDSLTIFSY